MKNINKVFITGNLTREPELRRTQAGLPVLTIGMAVNDSRKNENGEWEDYANFVNCVMLGERAEKVAGFLYKGMKVSIEGKLHYSSWQKDGKNHSKIEVIIDQIEFMARKGEAQGQGGQDYDGGVYDDDIPF